MARLVDVPQTVKQHFAECEPKGYVAKISERQCDRCGRFMIPLLLSCPHARMITYSCEGSNKDNQHPLFRRQFATFN